MTTQPTGPQTGFEETLISTVRGLVPRRAVQVLDFARWLQTQSVDDDWLHENVSPEELTAEDSAWDQVYLENRETFRSMAREALEEYEAGATREMFVEDGKLSAR